MKGCTFLIVFCAVLLIEVHVSSGQYDDEDCPYNELDVECVNRCNTCDRTNSSCTSTDECEPGCDCKPGFLRNKFGYCIPRKYCGQQSLGDDVAGEAPKEPVNESADSGGCPRVRRCIRSCRRRGFRRGICTGFRRRQCRCISWRG